MKLIKNIFKSLLIIIAIFAIVGFFLPQSSNVSRSLEINAPASKVFGYINDFKQFNRWSPWFAIDPDMKIQFEGPAQGVGSKIMWSSDDPSVGHGSQEITSSIADKSVVTHLEFEGQGDAEADFALSQSGDSTEITWGFNTDWGYNLIGRYMGLMMDDWVGGEYEKGLASLKKLVESE